MKQKVKSGIKIYVFLVLYLSVATIIYTLYINKTNQDFNLLAKLIIGGIAYLMLGFTYANAIHKKGFLIGIIVGIVHFFLIELIYFLCKGIFQFEVLPFFINVLLASVGGMLGVNIKKLF